MSDPGVRFAVRGWCPDAWRPMMAGDGLLVRIRPRLGQLSRDQALGLCGAALTYGNGAVDVTNRANLQVRGVTGESWRPLLDRLIELDLIAPDPAAEAAVAILVAPIWRAGDDTHRIATALSARLGEFPALPGKFGIAIDAGAAPVLTDDPGDFRIERGEAGALILRVDGRPTGAALVTGEEVDALIALSHWFVATGGRAAGRMARHHAMLPGWAAGTKRAAPPASAVTPGTHTLGVALGMPFGRIEARPFADYIARSRASAIRTTPWRVVLVENAGDADVPGFALERGSPLAHVDACVGAPACPQASVDTRELARCLAPAIAGRLHVSGCAKGCARSARADIVLTGCDGRYDLGMDSRAGDPPRHAGLNAAQVLAYFGAR